MELQTAGLSPVLYHVTEPWKLVDILKQDRFVLRFAHGSDTPGKPDERFYFMSAMRVPSGGYRGKGDVILVLDGQKLGQRYKGSPMDYWGPEWRKTADKAGADRAPYDEAEDRVWARGPIIPDAHQYIQEIHLAMPEHERYQTDPAFRTMRNQEARKIILAGKKFGIPVFIYRDRADFKLLNKAKATPLRELKLQDDVIPEADQWMLQRRTQNPGYKEKRLDSLIELYWAEPDRDKLSPEVSRELYATQGRDFPHTLPEMMKLALPEWRKKLTDIWRKIGVQDAVGYGKWLSQKFWPTLSSVEAAIQNPQFSTPPRKWDGRNAIDRLMAFGPEAAYVVEENPVEWVRNHVKIPVSDLYYQFHPKTDPVTGETTEPPVLVELPDSFFEQYRTAVLVQGVDFRSYQKSDDLQETIMRVLLAHRDRPPQITLRTVNPKQEKRLAVQQLLRHGISGQTVLADVPILLEPAAEPLTSEPEQPINPIQLQLIRAPGPGESVEPLAQDRMDLIRSQYQKQALRADTFEDFQELLSHTLVEQQLVEQYRRTVAGVLNGIRVPLGYVAL